MTISMSNLLEEAKEHFNEPVLIGFELCRIIGYAETDEDCYLITNSRSRGITWNTFVGGYTYLNCLKVTVPNNPAFEGEIWTDYSRLDSLLELNGVPKQDKFMVVTKVVVYLD